MERIMAHAWLCPRISRQNKLPFRPEVEALEKRETPSINFAPPVTFAGFSGGMGMGLAQADLNGDGKPDLIAVGDTNTVSVLRNTTPAGSANLTFAAAQTFATGNRSISNDANAVAAADFNGDGKPDLVVANLQDVTVSVLLNTTTAGATTVTLQPQQTFAAASGPIALAVADFNGDGKPDIAVACFSAHAVAVLLNTTAPGSLIPSFTARQTFAVGTDPQGVAAADFNGDGKPDLVVSNASDNTVSVLLNTTAAGAGTVSFAAQQTFATGSLPLSVAVADVNGDGRPDPIIPNDQDNTVSVLLNTTAAGASTVTLAAQQTFATGVHPDFAIAGDFDGDGRPDLAVADATNNALSVLANTTAAGATSASFADQLLFPVGAEPQAGAVVAADFNGDGLPDLAAGDISVLLNTSRPVANPQAVTTGQGQAITITLTGSAPAGDALTFAITANPSHGGLSGLNATTGQVTYTPTGTYTGPDSFSFTVTDTTTGLTGTAAVSLTVSAGHVPVGQFGSTGVWQFDRAANAWVQLTPANAILLAADSLGDVAAEFRGYGLWEYRTGAGWNQLHGVDVSLLAMNAAGAVAAEFPGYGVGQYTPASGWHLLTAANASLLSVDANGDIAAEFPGYGVWEFTTASNGWTQLHPVDVTLLAMDAAGDVAANFPGYGVGAYTAGDSWRLLNGTQASSLTMDTAGDVAANFPGYGVAEYTAAAGWRSLTAANAALLTADILGDVYAEFAGYGVWQYDATHGWTRLRAIDASLLATT
jgi:hypothetical protein